MRDHPAVPEVLQKLSLADMLELQSSLPSRLFSRSTFRIFQPLLTIRNIQQKSIISLFKPFAER